METNRILGLIGLCRRAGQLTLGTDAVREDIRRGRAECVLLDEAASERTQNTFRMMCAGLHVPIVPLPQYSLSGATGKNNVFTAAVLNGNFAKQILALYDAVNDNQHLYQGAERGERLINVETEDQ